MMKLMTFLSLAACCLSLSCSFSRNRASDNTPNADTPSAGNNEELLVEESEGFKPVAKELDTEYVYAFENDTIRQRVALNYLMDTVIRFAYAVENKIRLQSSVIQGTAINKYSRNDPEIDQDEEGLAYPADEYVYSNQCWLAFRIHMETQALLQIMEADCQPNPYCPLESAGILKLVKQYKTGEKEEDIQVPGQTVSPEKAEREMLENAGDGEEIQKQSADLNGDGKEDLIYSCGYGDMTCLRVFLQTAGGYVEAIHTGCTNFTLQTSAAGDRQLRLVENSGGESPFTSHRTFIFDDISARPVENYTVTNGDCTKGRMTEPSSLTDNPCHVKTQTVCNLRFSPDMEVFENSADIGFTLGRHTNIIAAVKAGIRLKVLAELPAGERTWLYVEAEETSLENSRVTDFDAISSFRDHRHPAVRGWISNRYVERVP
jgi:hypothetical protein